MDILAKIDLFLGEATGKRKPEMECPFPSAEEVFAYFKTVSIDSTFYIGLYQNVQRVSIAAKPFISKQAWESILEDVVKGSKKRTIRSYFKNESWSRIVRKIKELSNELLKLLGGSIKVLQLLATSNSKTLGNNIKVLFYSRNPTPELLCSYKTLLGETTPKITFSYEDLEILDDAQIRKGFASNVRDEGKFYIFDIDVGSISKKNVKCPKD